MLRKQKSRQFHLLNEPTIGPASLSAPKETCHFLVSFLRTRYPVWILFLGSRNPVWVSDPRNPDPAWVPFLETRCGSVLRNSDIQDDYHKRKDTYVQAPRHVRKRAKTICQVDFEFLEREPPWSENPDTPTHNYESSWTVLQEQFML